MSKNHISRRTIIKGVVAGVAGIATVGVLGLGNVEYSTSGSKASAAGSMSYMSGTYSASAKGIASDVTVTMTFDESGITDVQIDVSGETAGIGAEIGDEMCQKILGAQSSDVDIVSGATITSDAIKAAGADCIAQAGK